MTQGRFDTIVNCRPPQWDDRRHWTNFKRTQECSHDHMDRESCPFHDLRAGGQFQYEYHGSGVGGKLVQPDRLNKRSDAKFMVHGKTGTHDMGGQGGLCDVEAGRPQQTLKRTVDGRPWTHVPRLRNGLFSAPEYMPQGPPGRKLRSIKQLPERSFSCGSRSVPFLTKPIAHEPDTFNDAIDRGRVFHFKTNHRPGPIPDSRLKHHPSPQEDPERRHPGSPFYAGKAPGATFGGPITVEPEPYSYAKIKNGKRPLFTWYTHSKFSMPVDAPWSTGKVTAEPIKGTTQTSLSDVPAVANKDLRQTIGREAALSSAPQRPGAVAFRSNCE